VRTTGRDVPCQVVALQGAIGPVAVMWGASEWWVERLGTVGREATEWAGRCSGYCLLGLRNFDREGIGNGGRP
jgi:hypothetical protein